jgi:transposase
MKLYPNPAMERAMKKQEVILRALSGEISWIQAAHILRMTTRNLRRLRAGYELHGYDGLIDRRCGRPSGRRADVKEMERILCLYRERYAGFNAKHFHEIAQREHAVTYGYTFVKSLLQEAGLVPRRKKRGPHRRRRPRKECFGEMLHVDGSKHAWLALKPELRQMLIVVQDDATSRILYAQLWPEETTEAVMTALKTSVAEHGIPMSLYSDRASWAFYTLKAGRKVDKERPTQVGRALERLGVEHIPAYSPQARGRSERTNRTLQDRLVNELRAKRVRTVKTANRYIAETFIPGYNVRFSRAPRNPQSAFVSSGLVDLDQVFCIEAERTVAKDNTVVLERVVMQLNRLPGRGTCAGMKVFARRHLDSTYSIWRGQRLLGEYDQYGEPIGRTADTKRKEKRTARLTG